MRLLTLIVLTMIITMSITQQFIYLTFNKRLPRTYSVPDCSTSEQEYVVPTLMEFTGSGKKWILNNYAIMCAFIVDLIIKKEKICWIPHKHLNSSFIALHPQAHISPKVLILVICTSLQPNLQVRKRSYLSNCFSHTSHPINHQVLFILPPKYFCNVSLPLSLQLPLSSAWMFITALWQSSLP